MEGLVGDERTQRINEQARRAVAQCAARGMYMEDERFAAAGRHDAHGGSPLLQMVEHFLLLRMQLAIADKRTHDIRLELRWLCCRTTLPRCAGFGAACFERFDVLGAFGLRLAEFLVGCRIEVGEESQVPRIEACLERSARLGGG